MSTYRFPEFDIEIIDPEVSIVFDGSDPRITDIKASTKQYTVDILMRSTGLKFGYTLTNVQAESLNWESEGANMMDQVMKRLEDFKVE